MNIVLIGFKAVGKTTYGKLLAEKLGKDFVDLDDLLVETSGENTSCREIFQKRGAEFFRKLETNALKKIKSAEDKIIAVGGGTISSKENVQMLKAIGKIVYLDDDKDSIFKRMMKQGLPAFINESAPRESFEKIFSERREEYKKAADIIIDCKKKTSAEIVDEIVERLA